MFTIIVTTILVSAFIILFFEPNWGLQNKKKNKKKREKPDSTIDGFVEDTDDAFINPRFPTQLIKRDAEGNIKPVFLAVPSDELDGHATVGIGHLIHYGPVTDADRRGIWVEGQRTPGRLTRDEAERLLARDLAETYEPAVRRLFEPGQYLAGRFEQALFDALVSFAYNLGPASLTPGTPGFETLGRAIQSGSRKAIAESLLLYDKAGGVALPGLTRRRRAERRLILTGEYG